MGNAPELKFLEIVGRIDCQLRLVVANAPQRSRFDAIELKRFREIIQVRIMNGD